MQIISVTGKKGKTTIVRLLSHILLGLGKKVISVDNDYYCENGIKILDKNDSEKIWGIKYMARCPGRFLGILNKNINQYDYFITEAASGCYKYGLGYEKHDVGIFSNLDSGEKALSFGNTKKKLSHAKASFIFGHLINGGYAIFDSENKLIINELSKLDNSFKKIGIGKNKFNSNLDYNIIYNTKNIEIFNKNSKIFSYNFSNSFLTFNNLYTPGKQNISICLGVLLSLFGEKYFTEKYIDFVNLIDNYKPSTDGGRLVNINFYGKNIILDYAHDEKSFFEIIKLFKRKYKKDFIILYDYIKNNNKYFDFIKSLSIIKNNNNNIKYIFINKDLEKKDLIFFIKNNEINNFLLLVGDSNRNYYVNLFKNIN